MGRDFTNELEAYTIFIRAETVKVKEALAVFWKTQKCMNHEEAVSRDHSCLQQQEDAQSTG